MKKKYVQKDFELNSIEADLLSKELGFEAESQFLLKKFKVTKSNLNEFFPNNGNRLLDPFLLNDMDKAVEKISAVVRNGGKILIFGDYDADGISASAILYNFFKSNGFVADVFIPKRSEGYGLNTSSLSKLFDEQFYDLILTVDCGITGLAEVRYVKDVLKTDIIVTDHHELCEALPDCICINPKRGYPVKDLSGSAVALKLVQALSDEETAKKYCDLAALGIVGDLMPLISENRTIVKLGLENINNVGLKALLDAHKTGEPDCSAFALKVCPKLNAAGRMGNPSTAFELLISDDSKQAKALAAGLFDTNNTRKQLTEETVAQALKQIAVQGMAIDKAIFVYNESWSHGMLGIVCNRLVDLFNVPVGAFTLENDKIVGSLRTVEEDNILATVTSISEHVIRFGGHKASVGVTLAKNKYTDFCNAFWSKTYSAEYKKNHMKCYDAEFDRFYLSDRFFNQLKSFEPFMPNDCVVLHGEFTAKSAALFGKDKSHLKILTDDDEEIKGFFNFKHWLPALKAGCRFECLVTLSKDDYTKKTVMILNDLNVLPSLSLENLYLENFLGRVDFRKQDSAPKISSGRCRQLIDCGNACFVFNSMREFESSELCESLQDCYLDFFYPSLMGNTVLISPQKDADLSEYSAVIYCGKYKFNIFTELEHKNIFFFNTEIEVPSFLYSQQIDRELCAKVYRSLCRSAENFLDLSEAYLKLALFEIKYSQFLTIIKIFEELGIVKIINYPFNIRIEKEVKSELENSKLYNLVAIC